MKAKSKQGLHRFQLKLLSYANSYYIERIGALETELSKEPDELQIDLIGDGEIPADAALLIRSILRQRSPTTRIITNARSSLRGGSVLVWLLGDSRQIRDDARLFFRRADVSEDAMTDDDPERGSEESKYSDSFSDIDPEEVDYAAMLGAIDEFLPVRELTGRPISVRMLRQFGLVENDNLDRLLVAAFGRTPNAEVDSSKAVLGQVSKQQSDQQQPGQISN